MITISFAITVCNEHVELKRLITQLRSFIRPEDEIVVLVDTKNSTPEVEQYVESLVNIPNFKWVGVLFNNDFASFKNKLKDLCSKDWVFFIDADEFLGDDLANNIHEILDVNQNIVDVIAIPRINTVEGLTRDHIDKWRWFVDDNGWVNYPDYQTRICANKPEINWINKVHERLSGWKTIANLPHGYDLMHPKTIERQERQNNFYNTI
jgi:glycosyltransferase involved in cell wall biosynthesis